MAKYIYVAKNQAGEVQKGEMEASEEREVVESLRKDGFWPTMITRKKQEKKVKTSLMNSFMSVPLKNRMIFCRHFGVMINSGLSLSKALVILSSQEKNKTFKTVIAKLAVDVKKGKTFADAMAKYPKVFGPVFVSMVRMGELSGNLEEILNILADQLEKDHKLISKVRGAMIYPSVIISVMLVIGVLMMIFVVPKLTSMFDEFGADLPIMTRVLITVSDFMESNATFVIGGMIAFAVGVRMFAKSPPGKRIFHKVLIKAPNLGGIITKVKIARFSRIISSLLDRGTS